MAKTTGFLNRLILGKVSFITIILDPEQCTDVMIVFTIIFLRLLLLFEESKLYVLPFPNLSSFSTIGVLLLIIHIRWSMVTKEVELAES